MLFEQRFWEPIAAGKVTVTYRRWRRPQVVPGRIYRTPAGRLRVTSVERIDPTAISDADAALAGYPDADALRADLRGRPEDPVLCIAFTYDRGPDPRSVLAADANLDDMAGAEITRRLDRLDRASRNGAWTRKTLAIIAERPAVRAPDLAAALGRDAPSFKLDVRKLKNLGLTESLRVGYRLSPRGRAYLALWRALGTERVGNQEV
jgi:hypothetical protein